MTDATPIKRSVHWRLDISDPPYGTAFVDVVRTVDGTQRDSIALQGSDTRSIFFPRRLAGELAELLTTAADWTDEFVVDAEIADDDRPQIDYHLLVECFIASRPAWMTREGAEEHASHALAQLQRSGRVLVMRNGQVFVP
ncbi:MAG: hypothetical protein JO296_21295 [Pseudonocardiales bacterium]|nr:hypothetical protein [Pseudonocardiales bacterium]